MPRGSNQPSGVPHDAELLNFSHYKLPSKERSSKFIPGLVVYDECDKIACPRCKEPSSRSIGHGEHGHMCEKCGLKVKVYGNALYIWE